MSRPARAEDAKAKAEAGFKKQDSSGTLAPGKEAAGAEQADAAAKTERLRAMRLAKEQSDQIAAEVRKARRES